MSTRRHQRGNAVRPLHTSSWISAAMLVAILVSALAVGFAWVVPMEVVQQWGLERAGQGTFARFEAVGEAEISCWLVRVAGTLLVILLSLIWFDLDRWLTYAVAVGRELRRITASDSTSSFSRLRGFVFRALIMAWMVLFAGHATHAIGLRIHDWPYFRFNSGEVVRPNISDSNRLVIRYLQEATPPDARILVASDQKLFFLSYYLRPRTLFHRMHPDSEHVIPLKDQQRKLVAYRLSDLTPSDLEQMPHDYTLEYFEHPDMIDKSHVLDDSAWISFLRKRDRNPPLIPAYEVRLKKVGSHD